ncbi:hypothetical protein, partial [Nostoc sp. 106C]|uniref:hypothetical protein n=1 Tax=Nostoc sp. 106C TaxID=1932667 RepID=UPI000B657DAE
SVFTYLHIVWFFRAYLLTHNNLSRISNFYPQQGNSDRSFYPQSSTNFDKIAMVLLKPSQA